MYGWKARVLMQQEKYGIPQLRFDKWKSRKLKELTVLKQTQSFSGTAKESIGNAYRALASLFDETGDTQKFYDYAIRARIVFESLKENDPENSDWVKQLVFGRN